MTKVIVVTEDAVIMHQKLIECQVAEILVGSKYALRLFLVKDLVKLTLITRSCLIFSWCAIS